MFGVENNELASRLACMLQESLDLPRLQKIDILRFYHVLSELFEERDKKGFYRNQLKLAFRMLDHDNDGVMGSVDVCKLKAAFEAPELEKVYIAMYESYIKKRLPAALKTKVARAEHEAAKKAKGEALKANKASGDKEKRAQ